MDPTDRYRTKEEMDMEGIKNVNISGNRFSIHRPSATANNIINLLLFRNPRFVLYSDDNNDD